MSNPDALRLLRMTTGAMVQQAVCAATQLGIADRLKGGERTSSDLAGALEVSEDALYRVLRFLSGEGVFVETGPRCFANSSSSEFLRTDIPGSLRSVVLYRGSQPYVCSMDWLLDGIRTGKPGSQEVLGMNVFEYFRRNPREASAFDEAMTAMSALWAPDIAAGYDFGKWGSLMDVGGGNGLLLAEILRVHSGLRGVLAEQPYVLDRARQRGFLSGDVSERVRFEEVDFFEAIPRGCRAYLMKSILHDWDDDRARRILLNCRRAVPDDGAYLLVEYHLGEENVPSIGKSADMQMLIRTGGRERTVNEHRELFASAGFRLSQVIAIQELMILEAEPA